MEHIFTYIYERNIWGNNQKTEYSGSSGEGSSVEFNKEHYIPTVQEFITNNNIKTVADLGCGDFRCGPLIYDKLDVTYTGYDVYNKIIECHKTNYKPPKYNFINLDICNQKEDNKEILDGGFRHLSSEYFPLKKYNAKMLKKYYTKEISIIDVNNISIN